MHSAGIRRPLRRRVALLALSLALICLPQISQANSALWRSWQAKDGLSASYVGYLSRDLNGALWAVHGEVPGLSRFDGERFEIVASPPLNNRFETLDGKR